MNPAKHEIMFEKKAIKQLQKIDKKQIPVIKKSIQSLATNPNQGKPLSGNLKGFHSLRIGVYRVLYEIKEQKLIILIIEIGHRKEIYK